VNNNPATGNAMVQNLKSWELKDPNLCEQIEKVDYKIEESSVMRKMYNSKYLMELMKDVSKVSGKRIGEKRNG